ncbi:alpha-galactosidase [Microbacterium sp. CFH 31415]|uniref:alpha-galactosidase n=1 Tax=Microbacterium sp. CFH 31415 TaxID=2921732 RepID=UPI001F142753|nr:alpha-galactosidase [Microbacterium sp. CFH 31415]MCH6231519.1 alpha-galactosidase [Microbacterium sp. CFH 31415]
MIHHLRAAGVSLVLDSRGAGVPAVVHWGRDLGALDPADLQTLADAGVPAIAPSSIDVPLRLTLLPALGDGWTGRPAVALADGRAPVRHLSTAREDDVLVVETVVGDAVVTTRLELTAQGVLLASHTIRNDGDSAVAVTAADVVLPVPDRAREVLDFSGRWAGERRPQRGRPGHGAWLRETRHGRGGHDDPFLMVAGTAGFDFGSGEVWSTHVAWSGDTRQWFERSDLAPAVLGAGERFASTTLAPGESYASPTVVATWSGTGLDGLSDRLHPWVRSWSTIARPRPLTLNTWEAVYFDHSLSRLEPLVERASEVGVERFVLDDGWFLGRTDDRRALGDWTVDPERWPDGLGPLAARVNAAGMEFGLWVEPEMVSLDSDLAQRHPEWLLTAPESVTWRWQHVLDLSLPEVQQHLFDRLDALLDEYPIAYLKWDHNRDLLVEASRPQVLGLYRLLDRLRAAHPGVDIESCASGGGRIDLEILRRVDRVWTSDTNDPLVRQAIQRWTGIVVPPEYLGSHVGDARAHTTGRVAGLGFRLATALFGHAGIESDLTRVSPEDLEAVRRWAEVYREHRALLHAGRVVRADAADRAALVHAVVAPDRGRALVSYAVVGETDAALPAPLRLPGLDPARRYRVTVVDLGAGPGMLQDAPPPWFATGEVTLPGAVLADVGLPMPLLQPGNAVVLRADAD